MNRNSIRWRLPASYTVIALLAALSLGSMMLLVLRNYYTDQELEYLYGNAGALQPILAQLMLADAPQASLQDQVNGLAFLSQTQIKLYDADGTVIADSGIPNSNQIVSVSSGAPFDKLNRGAPIPVEPPKGQTSVMIYSTGEYFTQSVLPFNAQTQPGMSTNIVVPVSASPYGYGFVQRTGFDPSRRSSHVVSVLLIADGKKLGVLEFSNGPSYGADVIDSVTLAWLVASVFAIAIAALTGWFMSRRVTRPVLALENATRQMEQGNLSVRVDLQKEKQQEFLALANSFNGMAEQVEQTVSTLRAFVADAAHELHTPLTALQANLELARDGKNASARTRYLSRAQEQGQRLEALVKSLLDLSRIEAAESKSNFTAVEISQILHEIGEQFASRAEQANRVFQTDLPEEKLEVVGDEKQLRQVFMNLMENAIKFTRPDDSIGVSARSSDGQLQVEISDTGIGIPADDLPNLFMRFHRGRNASEIAGNGLGLAIVHAIVQGHGGTVSVASQGVGQGSRFTVTLPLRMDQNGLSSSDSDGSRSSPS